MTEDTMDRTRPALTPYQPALTLRQPWADLVVAGVKPVENRSRPVPSTLPETVRCVLCGNAGLDAEMTGRCNRNPSERTPWDYGPHECDPTGGPFPFRLAIHAAKGYDKAGNQAVTDYANRVNDETHRRGSGPLLSPINLMMSLQDPGRRGALVGWVTVTGQHEADECRRCPCGNPAGENCNAAGTPWEHDYTYCSRLAEPDCWHYELADPQPLDEPVPMKGQQGWWYLPKDVPLPT